MKVKILENAMTLDAFEIGKIYDAKRKKDFTEEEVENEMNYPQLFEPNSIFVKRDTPCIDESNYLWFTDDEIRIVEE